MRSRAGATLAAIEAELATERADALSRIGRRLEALLRSLDDLTRQCRRLSGAARDRAAQQYRAQHDEARRYRWYLEVQREAVGLSRHDAVDRVFPLPPRTVPMDDATGRPAAEAARRDLA